MIKEDQTFNELRRKSVANWLEDMSHHDDIAVRDGVRVTSDYIAYLQKQLVLAQQKSALKDQFLKQLTTKKTK